MQRKTRKSVVEEIVNVGKNKTEEIDESIPDVDINVAGRPCPPVPPVPVPAHHKPNKVLPNKLKGLCHHGGGVCQ